MTNDYIILGAGASGLMLAYRMALDSYFNDKSVLIIDQSSDKGNDRTWCYWEEGPGEWDTIPHKSWDTIFFGGPGIQKQIKTAPYQYKMIRSLDFYQHLWKTIKAKPNFKFVEDRVVGITDLDDRVEVETTDSTYRASKVLNSIVFNEDYKKQDHYPVLQQHFVGWFVTISEDIIDDTVATFMDFNIPQNGNTRFMYILPVSKTKALFEYTLFSKDLLNKKDYENAIQTYLYDKGITNYSIDEKEYGSIPMTSYKFHKHNTKNVLNIGTAGGWTKASTGYTFSNTTKKTKRLVQFLKTNKSFTSFHKLNKFWFYDVLLLDVLHRYNEKGAALFSSLFKRTTLPIIFKFLDEESNLSQDLKIITSVPSGLFLKALWRRLF